MAVRVQNNISSALTLFNAARIMIRFGAWRAIDLDGGGSSAMWVKDRIVNSPINDGVVGQERYVGTHIVMFVEGVTSFNPKSPKLFRNNASQTSTHPKYVPSCYRAEPAGWHRL